MDNYFELCDCCDRPTYDPYYATEGEAPLRPVCMDCARRFGWRELHAPDGTVLVDRMLDEPKAYWDSCHRAYR